MLHLPGHIQNGDVLVSGFISSVRFGVDFSLAEWLLLFVASLRTEVFR